MGNLSQCCMIKRNKWSASISPTVAEKIFPNRLPPQFSIMLRNVPMDITMNYLLDAFKKDNPDVVSVHRITNKAQQPTTLVRGDIKNVDIIDELLKKKIFTEQLSLHNYRIYCSEQSSLETKLKKRFDYLEAYAALAVQSINYKKTEWLWTARTVSKLKFEVYMEENKLQLVNNYRHLGYHASSKLGWSEMISVYKPKIRQRIGILRNINLCGTSSAKFKRILLDSYVRPLPKKNTRVLVLGRDGVYGNIRRKTAWESMLQILEQVERVSE